ncbi:MAG: hypothetical protein NTY10_05080 [Candidatus Omnitrophica bacterium]|nr:hypothetical protein [Candidatus Omnitrophota bacterium]
MKIEKVAPAQDKDIPNGVLRLDYRSGYDGLLDWTLLWPPDQGETWIICIHGHGESSSDQLYKRIDLRDFWLPKFRSYGAGIVTPNLRGNAWMSPAAAFDVHELLDFLRAEYGARRFVFASGSMGGTSNLIYAVLYPEDAAIVLALCPATDLSSYHAWCRERNTGVLKEIADAIEISYGGLPGKVPEIYEKHSAVRRANRLTMPVYIAHGCRDEIIPVSQSRLLVGEMANARHLVYVEIPGGGHDAPLNMTAAFDWLAQKISITGKENSF